MSTSNATPVPAVASIKPLKDMTADEKVRRYRELRNRVRQASDQTVVKGKDETHYFWANKTDDPELIRLQSLGYTIVKEPDPQGVLSGKSKPRILAAGLQPDGTYVRGDVILMEIPQEEYDFFLLEIEQRHEENRGSIVEEFRTEAEQAGAPTFTVDRNKK